MPFLATGSSNGSNKMASANNILLVVLTAILSSFCARRAGVKERKRREEEEDEDADNEDEDEDIEAAAAAEEDEEGRGGIGGRGTSWTCILLATNQASVLGCVWKKK